MANAAPLVRRFYQDATAGPELGLLLDGKPVKTPGRRDLVLPNARLAEAIADEWQAQEEKIDPRAMPLTRLAYAALDRVATDRAAFAAGLARYGESDLLYYRVDEPAALAARQTEHWDPILAWAQQRYDVVFELATGIVHMPQPGETVARLGEAVAAQGPFELAGLSPLVTVSGSLLVALALAEGEISLGQAWAAAMLDEQWQAEQWGEDAEAAAALAARRRDFEAASRFLSLL